MYMYIGHSISGLILRTKIHIHTYTYVYLYHKAIETRQVERNGIQTKSNAMLYLESEMEPPKTQNKTIG